MLKGLQKLSFSNKSIFARSNIKNPFIYGTKVAGFASITNHKNFRLPSDFSPKLATQHKSIGNLYSKIPAIKNYKGIDFSSNRFFTLGTRITKENSVYKYDTNTANSVILGKRSFSVSRINNTENGNNGLAREVMFDYDGKTKKEYVNSKAVGYWLLYCSSMCFGIIVWGGLTRLTESGLSIVEWAPISGVKLPTTETEWEIEFEKYKSFPEYQKVHIDISMEDFKKIYFMEWFHRNIGRLLGLVFVIPAAYFISKGKVHKKNIAKVVGLGSLIGAQGAIGWFMVSSGLEKDLGEIPEAIPRVSQYRLTAHLGMAYLLYVMLFMYGSKTIRLNKLLTNKIKANKIREVLKNPRMKSYRNGVLHMTIATLITCLSGGMVAGLDAGLVYNEFPMMGNGIIPPKEEIWSENYAEDIHGNPQPMWYNLFENPTTVQLIHRGLATAILFGVSYSWWIGRRMKLNRANRILLNGTFIFGLSQVALGILTLVNYVPVSLASAHQANSVMLVATLLGLHSSLKQLPRVISK
ncbi:hypothetical protein BB559_002571 [Furculomyces boomerangus]|uniref:Cytochrome c oxidase assembly protein COX15 n=1 Tax=Furculomyces boomerangus TaxID=61424 RepID=A0A2T9YU88_9FUNG|nr:hypothetical protein BB559_002571 [Furculomyces boomerangus]